MKVDGSVWIPGLACCCMTHKVGQVDLSLLRKASIKVTLTLNVFSRDNETIVPEDGGMWVRRE